MIITETDRLIIRESSGRDFSRIYCMMQSAGESETTDRISDDENEELEKYLAYIHTVYSVFGFGLWTVCLKPEIPIHPEGMMISEGLTESISESCLGTEPGPGLESEFCIIIKSDHICSFRNSGIFHLGSILESRFLARLTYLQ